MVLKIGIKRIRDLVMLRPSRADLAAEAVLASLNCTRAIIHTWKPALFSNVAIL
jgi:hypothetical protein